MKIDSDYRAVWVASVPRTGSMWTFNVVRDLLRGAGRAVRPEVVPHADAEMEAIGRAAIVVGDGVAVLKVHSRIPADLPHSFYLVTRRDLRDSLVSFMRFTHCDFDGGLRFLAGAVRLERHYGRFPADRSLQIEYGDIIARPEAVVRTIARRLGIEAGAFLAAEIVERYSKPNVEARLIERERLLRQKLDARQPLDVREFVPLPDHSLRAFDLATGFQSGHVSAYEEGDWRHILSPEQRAAVEGLIGTLRAGSASRAAS